MDDTDPKKDEWPPEDEYDALNDETFGDDGEEYNWEAGLALFNDNEKIKANGDALHKREGLESNNFGSPFEVQHTKQDYENDFDNENALAESISRLVMDEFDDEDEEEAMKSKLRRLGTATNFNTYFMPPQVASKHLQWFMDKELPGGSSLLGSSVWSMHPTSTPSEVVPTPNHQPTFSGSQLHSDSINVQINQLTQSSGAKNEEVTAKKLSDGGVLDRTSVNLNTLIGAKPAAASPQSLNLANHKPVFKTVEEIERELLEGNSVSQSPSIETPSKSSGNRPKVMTAEELERELIQSSTPHRKASDVSPMQNIQRHSSPRHPSSVHSTSKAQQAVPPSMTPPFSNHAFVSPSGRPPPGLHTPPGVNMNLNMNPMMIQQQQRMGHANMGPGPNSFAQRMAGLPHQIPPNIAAQLAYQQQQHHLRILQMNPHLRGRVPFMMPFNQMGHPMRHGFPIPPGAHGMASSPGGFKRPAKTDDPYGGLMNEKDKQRLRNIQIIQLQNDHPYTTDYYCLMYKVRHGVSDPKRQRDYLVKLFPRKSDESNRNNYQPAHFENSLGKLQAVSALAPKKAIDTVIRVVDAGPTNRSGMKAYRYLLLEVEKLYECLLKIQEADIRKTLLLNADESVVEYRSESTEKVIKVLQSPEKLSEILSVKKGKMLISRLIPLMDPTVRYSVFAHMIRNFPSWAVGTNSEIDKTYPFLRHCMFAADMHNLISMINVDVEPKNYEYMVASKLGLSLLIAAFHRAENIISESLPSVTDNVTKGWVSNARFAVLSVLLNDAELATPIEISPVMLGHFQRFGLNIQEMKVLENKIQSWASGGVPSI